MLKRFILAILLVFSGGVAHAQSVPSCTLTGTVQDASGAPLANGVINFDSIKTQVIAGQAVARIVKSINTNAQGVIGPNTFAQLLAVSITICDQLGNCGAPFSAIIPNQASSPFGNMIMGAYLTQPLPNPAASGQVFGVNSNNSPEWETVSGGLGNCSFHWNSTGSYTLNCPGFATLASPAFTGTVTMPDGSTFTTAGHNNATAIGIGQPVPTNAGNLLGVTDNFAGQTSTLITNTSATGTNTSAAYGLANADSFGSLQLNGPSWAPVGPIPADALQVWTSAPNGISVVSQGTGPIAFDVNGVKQGSFTTTGLHLTAPLEIASGGTGTATAPAATQIMIAQSATGYAPKTVSGDATLSAVGVLTVTKTGGTALGPIATLNIGTGLTQSAGNLNLIVPVTVTTGGSGTITAPTTAQILVAQSTSAYAPETMSGDATLAATGVITVTKTNGTALTPIATASVPLAPTLGGTGGLLAPSTGQMLIAQSAATYAPETISGDMTMTATGQGNVVGLHFGATNPVSLPITAPTSGGIAYFSSATALASSAVLTLNAPLIGGGAGAPPGTGTRSGNTTVFGTTSGTYVTNDCVKFDASGNLVDAGGACGISGGATYPNGSPPQFTGYSGANVSEAETLGGDAVFARTGTNAYGITVTKTSGVAFTGMATASIPLSVVNGGAGNGTAPVAGQVRIAQNATSFTPQTISGDATITSAGVLTVTKSSGTALTSLFAPLVNPAGGQNNYAPLTGGTLSGPTFSGTMTFPDGSTYTTAGHNNMKALGIGAAAPISGTTLLQITNNVNGGNSIGVTNSSAGTGANSSLNFTNDAGKTGWIALASSTYTAQGPGVPAGSLQLGQTGAGGIVIATDYNTSPGPPITFWSGSTKEASIAYGTITNGLTLTNLSGSEALSIGTSSAPLFSLRAYSASGGGSQFGYGAYTDGTSWYASATTAAVWNMANQSGAATVWLSENSGLTIGNTFSPTGLFFFLSSGINVADNLSLSWGNSTQPEANIFASGMANAYFVAGAHFNGSQWVADNNAASMLALNSYQALFYSTLGLTVGSSFSHNLVALFEGNSLLFPNTTSGSQIQFGTYNQPVASILGFDGADYLSINGGSWYNGSSWVASQTHSEAEILTTYGGAPSITFSLATNGTIGAAINWGSFGRFLDSYPQIQGLELPGFAPDGLAGNVAGGLRVGNAYFSATNWANVFISGASYPNGTNWTTDCGAGGGVAGLSVGPGNHIYMYSQGAMGCSVTFNWIGIASWAVTGMAVNHIENIEEDSYPVPHVSSGVLVKGSRDMFGWITGVKGGQTTLTFSENFDGESNCTLTDAGQPNLWFNANQTAGQVTFACVVPWTGEPCADGAIVEYHCFGQGA